MAVITISREVGSVGHDFGGRVAQALGYHFVDKEFIAGLLEQYGMVEFGTEYETRPGFWESITSSRDRRRSEIVGLLNQVVQGVAHHGDVVIQGRSGFAVLQDYANVLHVRLRAPLPVRVERVMAQEQMTAEQAAEAVAERDKVRRAFVEDFYGVAWDAMAAFDLVINTGKLSADSAITWVVEAAKALDLRPATGRLTTRSLHVEDVMAHAVTTALRCEQVHG
jgi:cytidylate kinase